MIDLDKLEILVKALKPCQWEVAHPNAGGRGWEVKQGIDQIAADLTEARARYIAAVNPAVALELIADARRNSRIQVAMALALASIGEALGLSAEEQENGEEELIEAINRLKADLEGEYERARERQIEYGQLEADRDALREAMNEILRVTALGSEAFGIAALVLGESGVEKEESASEQG
jgi:hypothetical protein